MGKASRAVVDAVAGKVLGEVLGKIGEATPKLKVRVKGISLTVPRRDREHGFTIGSSKGVHALPDPGQHDMILLVLSVS
ncbi:MAG: hypothetical protein CSA65_02810 [Proteobacteria bacterium]|nr:MAG: hypothetical protein CSB49_01485 [Pseudomonadota bacterium]PIE19326.1 MAG: hypothetical protein CSA65_02810 [Pseudomonadota bacterium]